LRGAPSAAGVASAESSSPSLPARRCTSFTETTPLLRPPGPRRPGRQYS
jgi:hypothetical protein